jgi:hypothetical protein
MSWQSCLFLFFFIFNISNGETLLQYKWFNDDDWFMKNSTNSLQRPVIDERWQGK